MNTQQTDNNEQTSAWQPDESLAVIAHFSGQTTILKGKDLQFASHVDFQKLPRGKPLSEEYCFVIVPTSTWNGLCEILGHVVKKPEDFRRFTPGRAYQISDTNTLWKHFPNGDIRVMLKMSSEGVDNKTQDFVDTVRWTQSKPDDGKIDISQGKPVNGETHPFVLVTLGAWNNFQFLIDELNIRDEFHYIGNDKRRPLAASIKSNGVIRITQTDFNNLRERS